MWSFSCRVWCNVWGHWTTSSSRPPSCYVDRAANQREDWNWLNLFNQVVLRSALYLGQKRLLHSNWLCFSSKKLWRLFCSDVLVLERSHEFFNVKVTLLLMVSHFCQKTLWGWYICGISCGFRNCCEGHDNGRVEPFWRRFYVWRSWTWWGRATKVYRSTETSMFSRNSKNRQLNQSRTS